MGSTASTCSPASQSVPSRQGPLRGTCLHRAHQNGKARLSDVPARQARIGSQIRTLSGPVCWPAVPGKLANPLPPAAPHYQCLLRICKSTCESLTSLISQFSRLQAPMALGTPRSVRQTALGLAPHGDAIQPVIATSPCRTPTSGRLERQCVPG